MQNDTMQDKDVVATNESHNEMGADASLYLSSCCSSLLCASPSFLPPVFRVVLSHADALAIASAADQCTHLELAYMRTKAAQRDDKYE